jgi:hypothetical protein
MSTYVPIQAITLSANTATVSFTGIPQTYTDLVLVIEGALTASGNKRIYFNGVGTDQSSTALWGTGSSAVSARYTGTGTCYLDVANAVTNRYNTIVHIQNYANTTTNKTYLSRHNSAAVSTEAIVGLWRSTAAITSFDLNVATGSSAVYGSGSTFTLYGIGAGSPKAFGGDEVRTDGTYWYHIYNSSGVFAPMTALTCDYLVVAGGGGGGGGGQVYASVGGGGAGGYRTGTLSLTAGTNQTVTVGAGGAGAVAYNGVAGIGSNSVFSSITSAGGGGGSSFNVTATAGGSGGGGYHGAPNDSTPQPGAAGNTPATTPSQGNNGGNGLKRGDTTGNGGGGGGAGGVGGDRGTSTGGTGGAGLASSISGTSVTRAGGGGGGGSGGGGSATGGGGAGGGGTANGANGTVNTGGGGGGAGGGAGGGSSNGGAGGSGTVIVRYLV